MNNSQTATIIKEMCKSKELSISTLLTKCEIRKSLIYDMEKRDWTPSAEVLDKIADYLNCSVDYLLGRQVESDEIKNARQNTKLLYEISDIPINEIEEALGVNYHTFRSWYQGHGDYFNSISNLLKLSELFGVSLLALLGKETPAHYKSTSPKQEDKLVDFETIKSADENTKVAAETDVSVTPKVTKIRHT